MLLEINTKSDLMLVKVLAHVKKPTPEQDEIILNAYIDDIELSEDEKELNENVFINEWTNKKQKLNNGVCFNHGR